MQQGQEVPDKLVSKTPLDHLLASKQSFFCKVCQQCTELNLFNFSRDAFTQAGYDNWKHALAKFTKHESSKSHQEAALEVANANRGTNVAGQLSTSHDRNREIARSALMCIVSLLHYLCKQGLAVRGHTETTGNFENLLKLRAAGSSSLKSWPDRSGFKWLSPVIQMKSYRIWPIQFCAP